MPEGSLLQSVYEPIARPSRRFRAAPRRLGALGLGLLGIAVWTMVVPLPSSGGSGGANVSSGLRPFGTTNTSLWCPATPYTVHSPRNVSQATPSTALSAGDALAATYEFRVYATNLSPLSVRVYSPTFTAIFPLASGPAYRLTFPPRSFVLNNTSWTSGTAVRINHTLTNGIAFSPTAAPYFYSARIAIMAAAPYGTLALDFRWQWTAYHATTGAQVSSPWSPSGRTTGGNPSVFDPSPYVQLATTDNRTVTIGTSFEIDLLGAISHTRFFDEIENASNGNVIRTNFSYTGPSNATPFPAYIEILRSTGSLRPVTLLEHVRNNCMELLYSITLHAVYPSSANVTFRTLTPGCGPIVFNGTPYSNGSSRVMAPSSHSYGATVGACPGHAFSSWKTWGGVSVSNANSNSTQIEISATGGLTVRFV
jgi:hypothetical protein